MSMIGVSGLCYVVSHHDTHFPIELSHREGKHVCACLSANIWDSSRLPEHKH